jgi:hypothetical protein
MSANGTGPMTVYNYVKDRDELEELVAAAVLDDSSWPVRRPTGSPML